MKRKTKWKRKRKKKKQKKRKRKRDSQKTCCSSHVNKFALTTFCQLMLTMARVSSHDMSNGTLFPLYMDNQHSVASQLPIHIAKEEEKNRAEAEEEIEEEAKEEAVI